jgi:TatD DNase family protein
VRLVDSHCHLDDAQFAQDRTGVIDRAHAAGLEYMLAIGTGNGPPDLEAAVRLADDWPSIYATVGVHPNDAPKIDNQTFKTLERLLAHHKVKAIGEIGLDYHWGVPKEKQLPVFTDQLAIASAARMPVIIHTRDAWTDTVEILRTNWIPTGLPCVMHCFTGDSQQARECLDMGFYLAFGGVTTFPKSAAIREAARITPLDRLLIETDSPYLAPVPHRGKRNEPAYVAHTARLLAEIYGLSAEELADQTRTNFMQLFRIPSSSRTEPEDQLN